MSSAKAVNSGPVIALSTRMRRVRENIATYRAYLCNSGTHLILFGPVVDGHHGRHRLPRAHVRVPSLHIRLEQPDPYFAEDPAPVHLHVIEALAVDVLAGVVVADGDAFHVRGTVGEVHLFVLFEQDIWGAELVVTMGLGGRGIPRSETRRSS